MIVKEELERYQHGIIGFDAVIKMEAQDDLGREWDGCSLWIKDGINLSSFWERMKEMQKQKESGNENWMLIY